jgi:integral membrane protein 2B
LEESINDDNSNSDQEPTLDSFKEEFDLQDEYAKITVPTFRDGRAGRFVHDFKMNQSGIIDLSGKRCFMMPLDRNQVVPPRSMRDLIMKVWNGYYNIDTDVIRQNMRVIVPEIEDRSEVSPHIISECQDKKIYKLESYVNGVFKRSADLRDNAKFAEFFGKKIIEYDFVNFDEVLKHENAIN